MLSPPTGATTDHGTVVGMSATLQSISNRGGMVISGVFQRGSSLQILDLKCSLVTRHEAEFVVGTSATQQQAGEENCTSERVQRDDSAEEAFVQGAHAS